MLMCKYAFYLFCRKGSIVKAIATDDNTQITVRTTSSFTNTRNKHTSYTQKLGDTDYATVTSNKPILLAQFVEGDTTSTAQNEPAMLVVPPMEQWNSRYTFSTTRTNDAKVVHSLLVVIEESKISRLLLDGRPVPITGWFPFLGSIPLMNGRVITIDTGNVICCANSNCNIIVISTTSCS